MTQEFLSVCRTAAQAGGALLLEWKGKFHVKEKAPSDLVTEADLASQDRIREILLSAFPDHAFVGEEGEGVKSENSEYRWIVDPLDGTTNYVHGMPQYSVSVALAKGKEIVCGVVFDPESQECYEAMRGQGAFLNGERIQVSGITELSEALVAVSFSASIKRGSPQIDDFVELLTCTQAMRRMGSAALNLCYVAAGRLDSYWAWHTHSWDVAAGLLLVQEAGGSLCGFDTDEIDIDHPKFIVASSPELREEMRTILRR